MLTEDYKSKLKNSNLIQLLLDKDNISPLESILDTESQYLKNLQKLDDMRMLDFGPELDNKELNAVFPYVKKDVDRFLGVSNINQPPCRYYNLFRPSTVTIPIISLYGFGIFLIMSTFLNPSFLAIMASLAAYMQHTDEQ